MATTGNHLNSQRTEFLENPSPLQNDTYLEELVANDAPFKHDTKRLT
jgi:hypothetical protein